MFPRMPVINGLMNPNQQFPPSQMAPGVDVVRNFPPMQRMPFPDNLRWARTRGTMPGFTFKEIFKGPSKIWYLRIERRSGFFTYFFGATLIKTLQQNLWRPLTGISGACCRYLYVTLRDCVCWTGTGSLVRCRGMQRRRGPPPVQVRVPLLLRFPVRLLQPRERRIPYPRLRRACWNGRKKRLWENSLPSPQSSTRTSTSPTSKRNTQVGVVYSGNKS